MLLFARDISFDKESVQHNFNKERTDRATVRAAYPLISDVSSTCMTYIHNVDLCVSLPAGDLEKRMPIFSLHKPNIDVTQTTNKSKKFMKSMHFSSY